MLFSDKLKGEGALKAISKKILQQFFERADAAISGEFLILGGSVLHLVGIDYRTTIDIDLASLREDLATKYYLALMEIAQSIGLPIEAINQAAAFFVYQIPNWQSSLVEVYRGKHCTFYRPDINLFLRLKINRLSESDQEDCLRMIDFARKTGEAIDTHKAITQIEGCLKECNRPGLEQRLLKLKYKLEILR